MIREAEERIKKTRTEQPTGHGTGGAGLGPSGSGGAEGTAEPVDRTCLPPSVDRIDPKELILRLARAWMQGRAGAMASDALAATGKGFGNFIMILGIIETLALFVMVFLMTAIG